MLILIAVVFVGFGVWSMRQGRAFAATAVRVGGLVVGFVMDHSADISTRHPVLRFRTVEGREVETTSSISHNSGNLRSGMQVPVLYDPSDPRKARIDYGRRSGSWPGLAFVALGVVFLAIGIALAVR
jgi:hypothetical protein